MLSSSSERTLNSTLAIIPLRISFTHKTAPLFSLTKDTTTTFTKKV